MTRSHSLHSAARVIFRVKQIDDGHLQQVCTWLEQGDLSGERIGHHWEISDRAIAAFLAERAVHDTRDHGVKELNVTSRSKLLPLEETYFNALTDYFLALVMRRKRCAAGRAWHRAVLAGQIVFVVSAILLLTVSVRSFTVPTTPEAGEIRDWLVNRYGEEVVIDSIGHEPGSSSAIIPVRFRYASKHRGLITSEQFFVFRDGRLIDVTSEL